MKTQYQIGPIEIVFLLICLLIFHVQTSTSWAAADSSQRGKASDNQENTGNDLQVIALTDFFYELNVEERAWHNLRATIIQVCPSVTLVEVSSWQELLTALPGRDMLVLPEARCYWFNSMKARQRRLRGDEVTQLQAALAGFANRGGTILSIGCSAFLLRQLGLLSFERFHASAAEVSVRKADPLTNGITSSDLSRLKGGGLSIELTDDSEILITQYGSAAALSSRQVGSGRIVFYYRSFLNPSDTDKEILLNVLSFAEGQDTHPSTGRVLRVCPQCSSMWPASYMFCPFHGKPTLKMHNDRVAKEVMSPGKFQSMKRHETEDTRHGASLHLVITTPLFAAFSTRVHDLNVTIRGPASKTLRATGVPTATAKSFIFEDIPEGDYTIEARYGTRTLTKTVRVSGSTYEIALTF